MTWSIIMPPDWQILQYKFWTLKGKFMEVSRMSPCTLNLNSHYLLGAISC